MQIVSCSLTTENGVTYRFDGGAVKSFVIGPPMIEQRTIATPHGIEVELSVSAKAWRSFVGEVRTAINPSPMRQKLRRLGRAVRATPHHYGCYPDISDLSGEMFEESIHAARRRYPRY